MGTPAIGIPSINTWLFLGSNASPSTFANGPIANVGDYNGPGMTSTIVDVTSHSNANPWRLKLTTLLDGGQMAFPLFFDPGDTTAGGHQELLYAFTIRRLCHFKLQFPDGRYLSQNPSDDTIWFFDAVIKDFKMEEKVADVIRASMTLEVVGEPALVTKSWS